MKLELILKLLVFSVVVSLGGWFLLPQFVESYNPYLFFAVPAFLTVYQIIVISFIDYFFSDDVQKTTQFLFGTKVFKVLLSIAFVLTCYFVVGLNTVFLVIFLLYYMIYIFFDSWMYMRCNREHKRKLDQHE
ncbi:hypothetical protein Bcop_1182 [Bacteroides coprosuis DSM 18011]|uniref:Transmembrane protein n=1 Tax=Bacteroides coprosuis DSM 18011 TaxID=679937 RepID=F3ZUS6_9BACE|nr:MULTISPECIES: hypothetical protein [Bacteroides]EGJ71386.1 hypothetical protein Bcop_1182 [Bacteroides coprosuis DSM 18011]